MILKGVTSGEGVVIATGYVETKDVLEKYLVAGNPEKVISTNLTCKHRVYKNRQYFVG